MTCGMPAMFYFYSHRGPQWNRMWKAGHGLLCGHRGLKPLWNADHMLCAVAIEVSRWNRTCNTGHDLLCGHRRPKMELDVKCRPWITLWASRSQYGTGREMLDMFHFCGH